MPNHVKSHGGHAYSFTYMHKFTGEHGVWISIYKCLYGCAALTLALNNIHRPRIRIRLYMYIYRGVGNCNSQFYVHELSRESKEYTCTGCSTFHI